MNNEEIKKQVKKLKIFSKNLSKTSISGEFSSAFKGIGFDFHQLREYHDGDDIRFLDWKSYAKTGKLLIKEMIPERDRNIIIALDCSKSMLFSSEKELKKDVASKVVASLTFISENTKDKVGLALFSENIILWRPPKKGKNQSQIIIQDMCKNFENKEKSKLTPLLNFLAKQNQRKGLLFVISDWIFNPKEDYKKGLELISKKYDLTSIKIFDKTEEIFPEVGIIDSCDSESSLNFSTDSESENLNRSIYSRSKEQEHFFKTKNIKFLKIKTSENVVHKIGEFFSQKTRHRKW